MKVWIVNDISDYESSNIEAVFISEELAQQWIAERDPRWKDSWQVEEYDLIESPSEFPKSSMERIAEYVKSRAS
jgi:hypothetical protein